MTLVFFLGMRAIATFDWGPVLTGYVGTWLLGAVLIALGVLASSLTRNQVIAALLTFVTTLLLFSIGMLDAFIKDPETSKLIQYFSLIEHMRHFAKGILDTRPIVCYLSFMALCLFYTCRVIGHPRWRS